MKTVEELFKEIEASEVLQKEFSQIGKGDYTAVGKFLKKYECAATAEEFIDYLKAQKPSEAEGEIGDDDAKAAAGGYYEGGYYYTDRGFGAFSGWWLT